MFRGTEHLIGLDLNKGMENFISKSQDHVGDTRHIFKALEAKKFDIEVQKIDFVTYRNNLNKIMGSAYLKEPWEILVHRQKNGLIVLDIVKLKDESTTPQEPHNKFIYYGYKFEQYCTFPDQISSEIGGDLCDLPVDARSEYCAILKTRFDSNRVIIAAEMDCADSSNHYVELKTSRVLETKNQDRNFHRFKLLKYWIQSYLVNTPKIIVGFRDDSGIIQSISSFSTSEIPKLCRPYWNSKHCISLLSNVLQFLKDQTLPNHSYLLQFSPPYSQISLYYD